MLVLLNFPKNSDEVDLVLFPISIHSKLDNYFISWDRTAQLIRFKPFNCFFTSSINCCKILIIYFTLYPGFYQSWNHSARCSHCTGIHKSCNCYHTNILKMMRCCLMLDLLVSLSARRTGNRMWSIPMIWLGQPSVKNYVLWRPSATLRSSPSVWE